MVVEGVLKVVPGQPVKIVEPARGGRRRQAARSRAKSRRGEEVGAARMFTHFFIDRPILSSVISILIVLGGAVAMSVSPIEQYPELAPPQVTVEARYPGATAEVIANTVAAPIETQINGIDNLLYFNSVSSSSGNVAIIVVFKPGSNPDINQVNVQNRVSQALPQLPQVVSQQGVTVDKKSSSIMMVVSVFSPDDRYDATYIDNYTNLYVLEELKRVPGANRVVGVRPARHRDAGLAAARPHGAARHLGAGGDGRDPEPEPDLRHRPDRRASRRRQGVQQTFVVTAQGLLHQAGGVREHHRAHREGRHGDRARARHRPRRARQARLLDRRAA